MRCLAQDLHEVCRPSGLRLFLENSVTGRSMAQLGQRFMAVNIAVVDRISAISQEREKKEGGFNMFDKTM